MPSGARLMNWTNPLRRGAEELQRRMTVNVLRFDMSTARVDVRWAGFPGLADPVALAQQSDKPRPLALVNGDFFDGFDSGAFLPEGPVMNEGRLAYGPRGERTIVGETERVVPADEVQRVQGTVSVGRVSVPVAAANPRTVPRRAVAYYDSRWTGGAVLPAAPLAIVVRSGKVTQIKRNVAAAAPRTGAERVLLIPTSLLSQLTRTRVGLPVRLVAQAIDGTHDRPRTVRSLDTTTATVAGEVVVGDVRIPINAVNYPGVSRTAGTVFDAAWTQGRIPDFPAAIVIRDGRVARTVVGRNSLAPNPEATVVGVPRRTVAALPSIAVGAPVTIDVGLQTATGQRFTEVSGARARLLQDGIVVAPCDESAESLRPRTVLGWDKRGLAFMMAVGAEYDWYGMRMGGGTLTQVATWLKAMGATDAVNLDGGASTLFAVRSGASFQRIDISLEAWRREVPTAVAVVPR